MRQLVVKKGKVIIEEVPMPIAGPGEVVIRNIASAISIGTERAIIQESGRNTISRVCHNPSLIKMAFGVLRSGGLKKTIQTYDRVMDTGTPIGYSSCGRVEAIGASVTDLVVGDIVACGGGGKATHAEFVAVPRNLVARVPLGIKPEDACYATLGSVVVHGLRRAQCEFGENVAIVGLGFLGLLACQIAKACGMEVYVFDPDQDRVEIATALDGILGSHRLDQFEEIVNESTEGHGVDAVLICANTNNSSPVDLSLRIIRNEGRIVLVGVAKIDIERDDLYKTEAKLSVSRSYGPGRYDVQYEEKGLDYPYEYVRWTENRNMAFVLKLFEKNALSILDLTTHRVAFEDAPTLLEDIASGKETPISAVIHYSTEPHAAEKDHVIILKHGHQRPNGIGIGLIGAGSFAQNMLLPTLKAIPNVDVTAICTKTPLSAKTVGSAWGASFVTTDFRKVVESDNVSALIIATPHHLHATSVIESIKAQKPVFVEKPPVMNEQELLEVLNAQKKHNGLIVVGFNRRYAPLVDAAIAALAELRGPTIVDYEVHVPSFPPDHWVNDPEVGGGRLVGEACHFLDLTRAIIQTDWKRVRGTVIPVRRRASSSFENFVISTEWIDGSYSTLKYTVLGSSKLPKEYLTIHRGDTTIVIDDFKEMRILGREDRRIRMKKPDKGHSILLRKFVESVQSGETSVQEFSDAAKSMTLTFQARQALDAMSNDFQP